MPISRLVERFPMDFIRNANVANEAAKKNKEKEYMPATKCVLGKKASNH